MTELDSGTLRIRTTSERPRACLPRGGAPEYWTGNFFSATRLLGAISRVTTDLTQQRRSKAENTPIRVHIVFRVSYEPQPWADGHADEG